MIRSVLAILAGIVALSLLSFGIEAVLPDQAADKQNLWAVLFAFAYSSLSVVVGGYFAALLARRLPMRHAVIMGAIQAALVIPAMLTNPGLAPTWQWLTGMALVVPAASFGGWLRAR
jgi:hypothetical protein